MTKDEALRLALEALEYTTNLSKFLLKNEANIGPMLKAEQAITAIKAALEAKDEPLTENGMYRLGYHNGYGFGEAYGKTNAPQRTWVGLTDEEIIQVLSNVREKLDGNVFGSFAKAIEAKLKEKNT